MRPLDDRGGRLRLGGERRQRAGSGSLWMRTSLDSSTGMIDTTKMTPPMIHIESSWSRPDFDGFSQFPLSETSTYPHATCSPAATPLSVPVSSGFATRANRC